MSNIKNASKKIKFGKAALCVLLFVVLICQSMIPASVAFASDVGGVTTISTVCRGADGKGYRITAEYCAEAGIPADAILSVTSLSASDESSDCYVQQAEQALRCTIDRETEIQLFDIDIVSRNDPSVEYQPAEGASVEMKVRLAAAPEVEMGVVHFGEEPEQVDSSVEGRNVSFEATGFSVYALVSISARDAIVHDVSGFDDEPVYLSATSSTGKVYYFKGTTANNGSNTLIARTAANDTAGAAAYSFEKVEGTDNQFYMFLAGEGGNVKYLKFVTNEQVQFKESKSDATPLTIAPCGGDFQNQFFLSFVQNNKTYYLNLRSNDNGKGFSGSTYKDQGSRLTAYYVLPTDDDVLELDGKTYGIAWLTNRNTAIALTAQPRNATYMKADTMPVRANPLDQSEDVMIKVDGNIAMFSFHVVERNQYYISTDVGGATKYLNAKGGALTLVDQPAEYSVFVPTIGAGANIGRVKLVGKASGQAISLPGGNAANGFTAKNANSTEEYFYFADPRPLADNDFIPYTAVKVSVSDKARVKNGSQVVVYTRIWNDSSKEYEFYAINHDGSLKRCYDEGDTIRWAGTQVNTLLWEFTEYYYWLTRIPNYYYELQNVYSGKYIAPQYHSGQILSNRKIGINLNGRRYNDYYTTILAWDDYRYDYAGLNADGGTVRAVPMSKAQDFYFAIMDNPVPDEFSTVETVDNNDYGIRMHMTDYNGEKHDGGGRDYTQTNVLGSNSWAFTGGSKPLLDLVTTDLKENGYPNATQTGISLQELFPEDAEEVNHLFLKSTYEETGYFEFDSTKNFATKLNNGNFRLYNQLGTVETSSNSQGHGWFMPYNDISPNLISQYTNQTDVVNEALSTDDPRLGETLYSIPKNKADYHFGMEMEASFIQSESGLDAWGHDIIFEFAGDDDMWLFVDGELVLDLGGVHSAVTGSINFRTGSVTVPDKAGKMYATTLRDVFEQNFRKRNTGVSDADVAEYLSGIFEGDTSVFRDYSSHTMKMLYMERGAGASNLHMRFNLTTAVPGQLLLSKSVSGSDKQDYVSAKFPYQIYFYDLNYADFRTVSRSTVVNGDVTRYEYIGVTSINYQGTNIPVEYVPSYTDSNGQTYENVFFLKPGESAEVQFPGDDIRYYVKECGVNSNIYDAVSVNGKPVTGVPAGDHSYNYSSPEEVIEQRKVVKFDNHVSPDALRILSITKKLFDVNGNPLHYEDDPTGFRFRLYVGEGQDLDGMGYYRMDSYYVKSPDGNYCYYDFNSQAFNSIGKSNFDDLTSEELDVCTFTTSPSGAIDKIPADFTVEVRNLLVDTKFMVIEQDSDIPKGYSLIGYERVTGSYYAEGDTANAGVIRPSQNPQIIVKNHRGWGLTVEKVWSDQNFMISHDNIYFAVYYNGEPVPGTVRRMKTEALAVYDDATGELIGYDYESSLYYYFPELIEGASFADYTVKEVALTDPQVGDDGYVTSYGSITPLGGELQLINGGVAAQTNERVQYSYVVTSSAGEPTGVGRNVRTDVVTNTRPGIRIVKVDGNGQPLANAVFTLKDENGQNVMNEYYCSDSQGLVTYAYPVQNETYTLTEVETPDGYSALIDSITFSQSGSDLAVDGGDEDSVTVSEPDADGTITITIKNYQTEFSAVKIDEETDEALANAHFALYRQVNGSSGARKDYYPLAGYSDLVSDADGVIPGIDTSLPPDTYYLTETKAPNGYITPESDICFTVNEDGTISMTDEENGAALSQTLDNEKKLIYTLAVPNRKTFKSVTLDPQVLIADFGLDINYNVKSNNYRATDAVYTYIGICDTFSFNAFGTQSAPDQEHMLAGVGEPYKGKFGTLNLTAAGDTNYKIDTMSFTGEDEFCLVAHVTKIGKEATDIYVYEKLTYMPATTVYYEDDFSTGEKVYVDGTENTVTGYDFGKWTAVSSGDPATEQAADLAKSDSANIFGYDPNYTEFAVYSNASAHKVSVSDVNSGNGNKNWPSMRFDFAGTGFDIISVSGCDTGVFVVDVYQTTTDENGDVVVGKRVDRKMVDTYYGYEYGRLYADQEGYASLTPSSKPLYDATREIISANEDGTVLIASGRYFTPITTYYDVDGAVTQTPYYYDANGSVTATPYYVNKNDRTDVRDSIPDGSTDYEPNYTYAYAKGWVVNNSAEKSLYQIPVIKVQGLDYGTYRAIVQPRFTTGYGHYQTAGDYNYFDLYVDAIRIYDPAGVDEEGRIASDLIMDAYDYSSESFEKFTTLKNVVVGVNTLGSYNEVNDKSEAEEKDCAVVVDGNEVLDSTRLDEYKNFGPNNELYLGRNYSVAFEISASVIPEDVQIQFKKISDSVPTLRIMYFVDNKVYSNEVQIRSATDLSYSVLDLIGKENIKWKKTANNRQTSGLVIISNTGEVDSLISITNLKWTFKNKSGNYNFYYNTANNVTIDSKNVTSLKKALSFSRKAVAAPQKEAAPAAEYADGMITMTVTTGSSVDTLVVKDKDGNLIEDSALEIAFRDLDGDQRQWTVTVSESEEDDYTFLIYAENDGIISGQPIRVDVSIETELPEETAEAPTDDSTTGEKQQSKFESFVEKLRSLWLRFVDLIRRILAFFGIKKS